MYRYIFLFSLSVFISRQSYNQECHESGPEPHAMAPIGIMGGHTHSKGHLMASYRYMYMGMNGMSSKGNALSSEQVLQNSMMTPVSMKMQMHMVGIMYAPSDRITMMAMSSFRSSNMIMESAMDHNNSANGEHDHSTMGTADMESEESMTLTSTTMANQGMGDTKVSALIRLNKNSAHCIHGITGVQLPTGSVDASDQMHPIMPYGMQNGTGSVGAFLGVNYSWLTDHYLIGAQVLSKAPIHKNKRGYMSPVQHDASLWASRKWLNWMSSSIRFHGHYQTGVRGTDALINPLMSPAGNGTNEALAYADASLGLNLKPFDQWRVGIETGYVIYQYNFGTHMNNQWNTTAGIQFMMH